MSEGDDTIARSHIPRTASRHWHSNAQSLQQGLFPADYILLII